MANPLDPARKAYARIKPELYRIYGPKKADAMLAKMSVADSGQLILGENQYLDPMEDPVGTQTYIDELVEQKPEDFSALFARPSNMPEPKTLGQKLSARLAARAAPSEAPSAGGVDVNAAAQEEEVKKALIDDIRRLSPKPLTQEDLIWLAEQPVDELWQTADEMKPQNTAVAQKPAVEPDMVEVAPGVYANKPKQVLPRGVVKRGRVMP